MSVSISATYLTDSIDIYNVLHTMFQSREDAHIICLFQHFSFIQLQYCQCIAEQDLIISVLVRVKIVNPTNEQSKSYCGLLSYGTV
jgi:hypothetical protein